MENHKFDTRKWVLLAVITAIVVLLQMLGSFVHFGVFQFALVLAPIVVGAALLGTASAAWLGAVFGLVVLFNGDAALLLAVNVPSTIFLVLAKGIGAGLAAGFVYNLVAKKHHDFLAVLLAAVAAPVVNTGIFVLGGWLFFWPTLSEWAAAAGAASTEAYIVFTLVGLNFVVELAVNLVLASVIERIIRIAAQLRRTRTRGETK